MIINLSLNFMKLECFQIDQFKETLFKIQTSELNLLLSCNMKCVIKNLFFTFK